MVQLALQAIQSLVELRQAVALDRYRCHVPMNVALSLKHAVMHGGKFALAKYNFQTVQSH